MLTVFASAAGPQLMAEWHGRTGSYVGLLYWLSAAVGVLCVAVAVTPLPQLKSVFVETKQFAAEAVPAGE